MFKNILVPTDGSKLSQKAIEQALAIVQETGAKLTIMTVIPPYPPMYAGDGYVMEPMSTDAWDKATRKNAEKTLAAATKRATAKGINAKFLAIRDDPPYAGIIATAKKQKCDLILMASHGRRGLSGLLLGSETTKVLTHTKIPVLVYR